MSCAYYALLRAYLLPNQLTVLMSCKEVLIASITLQWHLVTQKHIEQ